jgi:hypothetical protein
MCTFVCMMVLKVMASMGQSSDEPCKKPPPLPPRPPKGKPPLPFKKAPPLPWLNGKPPPPLIDEHIEKAPPALPKRYIFVILPGPPPPKPPPAVVQRQPPQQHAVAYAAAAAAMQLPPFELTAELLVAAAASEEQAEEPPVKAPPFKKPPPPPPPYAQLSRWAQLNTIRCQCSCGLLRRDACERRVRLPDRLCDECMDIAYIRTNMGTVCRCRCRECK